MPDPGEPEVSEGAEPPILYSFDRVAAEYEATRYLPPAIASRLADIFLRDIAPSDWVLDAGVGTGRIGRALALPHPRTVGVDISPAMLTQFRINFPSDAAAPRLLLADLRSLPFPDATFARILTVHVVHLIADWQRALAEMWRVLRPGGTLMIGVEERSRSAVRDHFLQTAGERGLLSQAPRGAHLSQAVALLRQWTPEVVERRFHSLHWSHEATAAETLKMLAQRTYSSLWSIPEDAIASLAAETQDWSRAHFGVESLDAVTETFASQVVLYAARKQEGRASL